MSLFGKAIRTDLNELMISGTVSCLKTFDQPHSPGKIDVTWTGPDFGTTNGTATLMLDGQKPNGGFCADNASPCLTDADCAMGTKCAAGGPAYTLAVRVEKIP